MKFFTQSPAEQIAIVMRRVYDRGLTTATGGNISIMDEHDNIWITPKGFDKGSLTKEDIICVHPDGTYEGKHEPSSEIFFHRATYRARPDFRAVVHAHPVFCIAFSLTRTLPRVDLLPDTLSRCKRMRFSKYAMMGSPELGENMFAEFSKGADVVFLENHGVCVGGNNLLTAYQLFETIEFAAKLDLLSRKLGAPRAVTGEQHARWESRKGLVSGDAARTVGQREQSLRAEMVQKLHRGCEHGLVFGTSGVVSARVDANSYLITPDGMDNDLLDEDDLVFVQNGVPEMGKIPAIETALHTAVYAQHAKMNAVFSAVPVHVAAFACANQRFETSTVPESFYMLRSVPNAPFEEFVAAPKQAAAHFSEKTPVVLFENARIITTGESLFTAFDRLEVAEATAASILTARDAGQIILLNDEEIQAMKTTFHLE
ncbi:MAG: aldolase [Clostridiales bacterium]|nr:aldolase [Clostridiales bacterium]